MTGDQNSRILAGIGVSPGVAIAPAVIVAPAMRAPADEPRTTDVEEEQARVRAVFAQVQSDFEQRAEKADEHARPILEAAASMASDPGLHAAVDVELAGGKGPANAVAAAVEGYAALLRELGGYMAERVADLEDVRDRAVARILGVAEPGVPELHEPSILIAHDLAPSETATLKPGTCLGIVTAAGGPTSHTAILAAQLGIPAVVQVPNSLSVSAGTLVAVDGGAGEVIVNPTSAETDGLLERKRRRDTVLAGGFGPGRTSDGHPVPLLANIGTLDDARRASAQGVEGVGLFRTEFLFLDREKMPSVEEQTQVYSEVFEEFPGKRVVVRTLDAGADKPLQFADLGAEENPALGRRGLRLSMARPELLDAQLEALAAARSQSAADVRVMAPMVATLEEARWFVERVRAAGLPSAGVMIEVPAAALRSQSILQDADFASLGTNDLSQYTMAADRMQGELAALLNPWEPAVLDVVAAACAGGAATGKPVGVCGEAGGDPLLALVLVGLGVSSLSMATGRVPAVWSSLRHHSLSHCQRLAAAARAADTAEGARAAALALADEAVHDLI
ncbi:MAG: phosphoenolpyruvate--protein phosphotransferase [Propionibacteriaceae bacterium]|nr:phosphoenolpyruvate--protein phosphotransferase [Propionibacteriaceae bacterium]